MFKFEVQADDSGQWASNARRYATREEAEQAAIQLYHRWFLVTAWRVIDCSTGQVAQVEATK